MPRPGDVHLRLHAAGQGTRPGRRRRPGRGFLRDARGRYSTFRFPGARSTLAQKINDRGQITGLYSNTTDDPRAGADLTGFLLDSGGRYTRIAVPGALTTTTVGINNRGQVVGQYQDANRRYHGYLWERGRFRTIDAPDAVGTSLTDINDRGQVVGEYQDADGTFHGYVWERRRFRPLPTGAATGINNRGQITGLTGDSTAPDGFLLDPGRVTTFEVPGAQVTFPSSINDHGQIVGISFNDLAGTTASGFLRDARGRFTAINRPGKSITIAFDINNRGQIVGIVVNPEDLAGAQPTDTPPKGRMT
jgi:probable HAF family extracellular repeat protein